MPAYESLIALCRAQESAAKGLYSPQSDTFMLGMLVYELLTGRVPFFEESLSMAGKRILDGERPARPAQPEPGTQPLWDLHVECTVREPRARPSMAEVVRRVEAITAAVSVEPDSPTALVRPRALRQNPAFAR
jgi:serine/threonine protein kinase